MRLGRLLVVGLLAATAVQAAAQEASAPRRMLQAHEQAAYKGVGRLDTGDGYCTATLFSETEALTAAHCLFDSRGRMRVTASLRFRAGFRDGRDQSVRQVRRAAVHPDYRWNGPRATAEEIAADVALLELDQPVLTSAIPNYLPGALPATGGAVALLSYGAGRDRALSMQEPCRVLGRSGAVVRLDCEVAPGSSGSPVLARTAEGLRLVAVISAMGGGEAFAAVAEDTLPRLREAMAGQGPRRAVARPETGLASRAGAWKSSRPPAD